MFDGLIADDLARRADGANAESLKRLLDAAHRSFTRELWLNRLRRGRRGHIDLPLSPATGASADEALSLSLHLGLGLDAITLSDAFDRDPEQLGESLYRARRIVDPTIPAACPRYHEALGRYDDPTLDADDRLDLLAHVQRCERCASVLDRFGELDAELRVELRESLGALPPMGALSVSRTRSVARSLTTVATGLVLVVALFGAVMLLNRLTAAPHEPVPVLTSATDAGAGLEGWLVQGDGDGMLQAVNLETDESRPLIEDQTQPWLWPNFSPSKAKFWYQTSPRPPESMVVIHTVEGERVGEITWDETEVSRFPAGWLDDDRMLFVESSPMPIAMDRQVPPEDEHSERVLLAIDVASGEETELDRGNFQWVQLSPDGTMAVVVTTYAREFAGFSFELRPLTADGLGPAVASVDRRAVTFVEWSPDSARLFFTEIADEELPRAPTPGAYGPGPQETPWESTRLVSIDREGQREVLFEGGSGQWGQYPLATVSSDGLVLFGTYGERPEGGEPGEVAVERVTIWEIESPGDEPVALGEIETLGGISRAIWSPDRETLLLNAWQAFYLDDGGPDTWAGYDPMRSPMAVTYTVTPGRGIAAIGVSLTRSSETYTWLAEDILPSSSPPTAATFADDISAPEPVDDLPEELRVSERTAISFDGRYLVLEDSDLELPVLWDRDEARSHRLVSGLGDASWLPGSPAVIVSAPVSRQDPSSRLTLFGELTGYDPYSYGTQRWDPAGIGDDQSRRYAEPRVSPDGMVTSFFVVDDDGTTELWVAGWRQETRRVASWTAPANGIPTVPPVAAWIGETLLFTEPIAWENGLPQRSALMRLSWKDDSGEAETDAVVEQLDEIDGRGSDRGVAIVDLLPSPDGDEIAYRMRHYTQRADDRGRRDTIHVMSIRDATRSVEIARGTPGEGMSWSPDGEWLAAGLERRIVLLSPDGTSLDYLTGNDDDAQYPIWVSPDEIWFAMDGQERAIWRVFVTRDA